MDIKVEKLPNSELKIVATIEKSKVAASYENIVDKVISEADIKGFRKGKSFCIKK